MDGGKPDGLLTQGIEAVEKGVDLLLESTDLFVHLLVLIRVLEVVGAAVGRVQTLQVEMATSLARRLAVALDLASLALVAGYNSVSGGRTEETPREK